jgi:thiol:disulfide interchange protein DsbD
MRKVFKLFSLALVLHLFTGFSAFAQPGDSWTDKIQWSFKVVKVDDSHADIIATAKLKEHWHVFSINHDPAKADFTGMPTSFKFVENSNYRLVGKAKDAKKPIEHEDVLGLSLIFEGSGVFKQRIEVLTDKPFDVAFEYEFQVCDENGCLFPPAQEGKVNIKGFKPASDDKLEEKLSIDGDEAEDEEGNKYVKHNDRWVRVPEGNSVGFFKKYLKLGGSYE